MNGGAILSFTSAAGIRQMYYACAAFARGARGQAGRRLWSSVEADASIPAHSKTAAGFPARIAAPRAVDTAAAEHGLMTISGRLSHRVSKPALRPVKWHRAATNPLPRRGRDATLIRGSITL
jgi:hypothetical protein